MDMCRFTGPEDTEYKKVAAAFDRLATLKPVPDDEEETPPDDPKSETSLFSAEDRALLLDSLRFGQLDARQRSIRTAHTETCRWVLQVQEYLDWLRWSKVGQHHGLLWIKGNPGTGKSTLMKFALAEARRSMKETAIISFFFHARGASLEKSTVGMYRSLLVQLFELLPGLQTAFDSIGMASWVLKTHIEWSMELLKDLLHQAVTMFPTQPTHSQGIVCFIDALDECDEDEIRDMVSFFGILGDTAISKRCRFHVLFASRHYPHITITKGLILTLDRQAGHMADITTYINTELKLGRNSLEEEICGQLQAKSSGIFMWVVLVVAILNKEYDQGRTARHLQKTLERLPSDLHALFRDILTKDCNNRDEVIVCLQWILFAQRPLKPKELYFGVLSYTDPEDIHSSGVHTHTANMFILNSSKGLAEITTSKSPVVQFIHESVRDFLLSDNGLKDIFPDFGNKNVAESLSRLAQSCLAYLCAITSAVDLDDPGLSWQGTSRNGGQLSRSYFLTHAFNNILEYAEAAEAGGSSQTDFISRFPIRCWIELSDFYRSDDERFTPHASLAYILAEGNYPSLLLALSPRTSCFQVERELYGPPIFAAVAKKNFAAAQVLLELEAQLHLSIPNLEDLPTYHTGNGCQQLGFKRKFSTFNAARGRLSHVAELGDEILLVWLLAIDSTTVDLKDLSGKTPLQWAAMRGHEAIVKILLATNKVDINSRDIDGKTPLLWAAMKSHEAIVQILLATSQVDVNARDIDGRTPLTWAAKKGHAATVKLLLGASGIEIESRDNFGSTPLSCAVVQGVREDIVKLLLETGQADLSYEDSRGRSLWELAFSYGNCGIAALLAKTGRFKTGGDPLTEAISEKDWDLTWKFILCGADVNLADQRGRTPLGIAIQSNYTAVISPLLETGVADLNQADCNNRTPIMQAAWMNHWDIFEILFEKGADLAVEDCNGDTFLELAMNNRTRCGWLEEFLRGKGLRLGLPSEEIIERLKLHREHTDRRASLSQDSMVGDPAHRDVSG